MGRGREPPPRQGHIGGGPAPPHAHADGHHRPAAFLPFYLSAFFALDLRFLRVLRLLRILKLTRYSPALETFARVLRNERKPLVAALLMLGVLHIFVSSLMFVFEQSAQPEAFGSIPAALWWGIVTLTTVGYGDVAPVTVGGKIFGGLVTVMGVAMFALPAGILASGFNQEKGGG